MSDEKLTETAQAFLGGDGSVEAAGIFQRRGTTGAMEGAMEHGVGWQPESAFATFDRSRTRVTVHARVNVRTLTIEDPDTGRRYDWEGNRTGQAHAKDVIEVLQA